MKDLKSTRMLWRELEELQRVLRLPYQPWPDNIEDEVFGQIHQTLVFMRLVYKQLLEREGDNIVACMALQAAIALGEFSDAMRFLKEDIAQIQSEGGSFKTLRGIVELQLQDLDRSERWNQLLIEIDNASNDR